MTHGERFTRLQVLIYTLSLSAISLMPFASGMGGTIYLISALTLEGVFIAYAVRMFRRYSDRAAHRSLLACRMRLWPRLSLLQDAPLRGPYDMPRTQGCPLIGRALDCECINHTGA